MGGSVITGTAQALSRLQPARQRAKKLYLSEVEQGILFELDRLARKRPVLMIADNLHWWDSGRWSSSDGCASRV